MSIPNFYAHEQPSINQNETKNLQVGPRYPLFSVYNERIRSYSGWPVFLTQKPKELAEAGFYYKGSGDFVRCFYCGGGLENWERGDDPWIEHARWFPKCEFLQREKGREFVKLISDGICQETQAYGAYSRRKEYIGGPNITKRTKNMPSLGAPEKFGKVRKERNPSREYSKPTHAMQAKGKAGLGDIDVSDLETDAKPFSCGDEPPPVQGPSSAEIQNVLDQVEYPTEESTTTLAVTMTTSPEVDGNVSDEGASSSNIGASFSNNMASTREEDSALLAENKRLREKSLCKICFEAEYNILFLPCSHVVACAQCAPALKSCPVCRENITATRSIQFPEA